MEIQRSLNYCQQLVSVDQEDSLFGFRPLQHACSGGNLKVAKILLENGANIDASDKFYRLTPFFLASQFENLETVKLLLENGCKTEIRTHEGLTGLEMAMEKGFVDIVKLIAFHNK